MPISLKTQVECTAKTPISARRARVSGLCGFRGAAERVPAGSHKTGRCAGVRELYGNGRHRRKTACRRLAAEGEAAIGEAGQSRGVVCVPRRSHLPAVRAVSGIYEGVPNTAKNSRRALRNEKKPAVSRETEGFQRKTRGEYRKMVKGKEKFALWITPECKQLVDDCYADDQCQSRSEYIEKAILFYTGFLHAEKADRYLLKVLQQITMPERWNGSQSASDGNFLSWLLSRMSTTISLLRTRTLTPGAIRKCADSVWMKSKERTGELILKMRC